MEDKYLVKYDILKTYDNTPGNYFKVSESRKIISFQSCNLSEQAIFDYLQTLADRNLKFIYTDITKLS